jgi:cell division ATPase FtsA
MTKFPFFKRKDKLLGVLDIGAAAVKCLFSKREKEGMVVYQAGKENYEIFGVYEKRDFKLEVMEKTIEKLFADMVARAGRRPKEFILGLPVNILRAEVFHWSFKRKKGNQKIGFREEKEIWQKAVNEAEEAIALRFSKEKGILKKHIFFLTKKKIQIKINGYQVPALLGFKGQQIELWMLVAFLPKAYLENIERLSHSFNFEIFNIAHQGEGLIPLAEKMKNCLFLDIGAALTQFFIVRRGRLERVGVIAFGSGNFNQALSEHLGLLKAEAIELRRRYQQRLLSEPVRRRLKELFQPLAAAWLSKLKAETGQQAFFERVFYWGGGAFQPDIREALEKNYGSSLKAIDLEGLAVKNESETTKPFQYWPAFLLLNSAYESKKNF